MKAELRNRLLKAMCEGIEPRLTLEVPDLAPRRALLNRQADALIAVGDLLKEDPAGIMPLVTDALERVVAALKQE